MTDPDQFSMPLANDFIRLTRLAEEEYSVASTSEQIVAALINARADWLPPIYSDPLAAIKRLHAGGSDWWHTMLYEHGLDWRE